MAKLRGSPENPAANVVKHSNAGLFAGARSSKPFQKRLEGQVRDDSLTNPKIKPVGSLKVPPWSTPEPSVCAKTIVKRGSSDQEVKLRFLEHDRTHAHSIKLYTDGSKTADGVGCAVFYNDSSYVGRLSNHASVFTAELTALSKALELVYSSPRGPHFTIYSDSYSALLAIKQYNPKHPIIQQIQLWLYRISSRRKTVHFCWVPAHVGVSGNEAADEEAKAATRDPEVLFHYVPLSDMKYVFRTYVQNVWQQRWSSLPDNRKYKKIRRSVGHWPSSFHRNRRVEVVLSRLRIGHTRLTHCFLFTGDDAPVCLSCDLPLTVEHLLVHCHQYGVARRRYQLTGKRIEEVLGPEVDVTNLFVFLEDIGGLQAL